MKYFYLLPFVLILLSCSNNNPEEVKNSPVKENKTKHQKQPDTLFPASTNENISVYYYKNNYFEVNKDYTILISGEQYISILTMLAIGKPEITMYIGTKPKPPYQLAQYFGEGSEEANANMKNFLKKNNGFFSAKNKAKLQLKQDSTLKTITFPEIIELEDKYLWMIRPMDGMIEETEIIVELKTDKYKPLFHLFTTKQKFSMDMEIVKIAESISIKNQIVK